MKASSKRVSGAGESAESRMLVLFEDMSGKINALHDGLLGLEQRLVVRMDALEKRLDARMDVLEAAVRQNSADIAAMRRELQEVRGDLRERATAAELAQLQRRVEALENRVGIH